MPPGNDKSNGATKRKKIGTKLKEKVLGPETDVFWHPAMTTHPPSNYTPGMISLLKSWLAACHSRGEIRKAVLCYDQTVYIHKEMWNATWGCGYMNFLMACAALMVQPSQPLYFPLIDEPIPPGIRSLQQWIEVAWDAGFDPEGKEQLTKLIGTTKWIGTADIWVALSSRGIPSELVDFDVTKPAGVQPLVDWTIKYFTPKPPSTTSSGGAESAAPRTALDVLQRSPITTTEIMPFILQHRGHSRLVVGYEVTKGGTTNLLTFDCGYNLPKAIRKYALSKRPPPANAAAGPSRERSNPSPLKRRSRPSFKDDSLPGTSSNGGSSSKRRRPAPETDSRTVIDIDDDDDDSIEIVGESNIKNGSKKVGSRNGKEKALVVDSNDDDEILITGYSSPVKPPSKSPQKPIAKPQMTPKDLQPFRITAKALAKHKQYQVLYFPMTAPLTEAEQWRRRLPTSTKIC